MNTFLLHTMIPFEVIAFGPIAIGVMIAWIYAIVDVVRSEFSVPTNKVVWIMVLMFMPFLGVIFYFIFGRNQREVVEENDSSEDE